MQDRYLYLLVDLLSVAVPFVAAFEKKWIHFIGDWRCILLGLGSMTLFFILWDALFTHWGVWGFNDRYILGIRWVGLPVEEYLFFLLIGFCCLFVYASLNYLIKTSWPEKVFRFVFIGVAVSNAIIALFNYDRAYTFTALGLNAVFLTLVLMMDTSFSWKRFFIGYVFSFIPFTLVNGILTGSFTPEPVVWYNDEENLGIRLGTIPVEDSQYMMLMMLQSIWVYNRCKK